ncbi:MAG: restriction endonuclease subunit S [Saccharofermentans sp.]|nr:restriction endonuclease subunit S [Saccharofermentans sp.]
MGMKPTEIGMIPEEWMIQSFADTFRILKNNTFSRSELNYVSGRFKNIHYGDVLILFSEVLDCARDDVPYINDIARIPESAQVLQDGDIVMADTAEDETVGKVTEVLNTSVKPVMSGLHTIPCRVKAGKFVPKWLGYYMNSHLYHNQLLPYIHGTKVSSVSKGSLGETAIIVPPPGEQENIVKVLSDIDMLIAELQKLIRKKKDIRQGTMQILLTGKNRLQGFSTKWENTTLGKICDIKDGTHQTPHYIESGIPFYSVETITNDDFTHVKYISLEEHERLTSSYKIENGDVLMTRIGSIGKGKYVDWYPKASFYVSLALLKFRGNKSLANFIALLTGTEEFQREVELHSLQFAIPMKINLGQISDIRVRIPSDVNETVAIITVLNDMGSEIKWLEEKLNKYKNLKRGMMEELLTGRIRLI